MKHCCLILGVSGGHAQFRTVIAELFNNPYVPPGALTLLWLDDLDDALFPRACVRVDDPRICDALEGTLLHYPVIADSVWITETEAWEVFQWRPTQNGHRAR